MKFRYKKLSQRQLGQLYGVSSHEIGKRLAKIGLRDEKTGKPTPRAHQDGFCDMAPSGQAGYCWAWNVEKTVPEFSNGGYRLLSELPEELVDPVPLNGPFRASASCPKEILNADDSLAARTTSLRNAEVLLKLLNLAHERGVFNRLSAKDTATSAT